MKPTVRPADGVEALERFGSAGLTYLPGLDGLRGLAVAAVVAFHCDVGWARGGYLGVSLFFTLSGFLITSLLMAEHAASGSVSLRRFWGRRFRRLLPAAWTTLGLIVAATWMWGDARMARTLAGDVTSALAQVANWRFLLSGQSYGALFASPSPVLHFWSLAIEEQLYLLLPPLVALLLVVLRVRRRVLGLVLGFGALVSWSLPVALGAGTDRIYYGTDTRAGELLVGAVLAVVLSDPAVRRRLARPSRTSRVWSALGTGAAGVTVAAWATLAQTSPLLRRGGLAAVSVASVLLIVAVVLPAGPLRSVCGVIPLRWLGTRSYALYLLHWPILVFAAKIAPGADRRVRLAAAIAVSLAAAAASTRWVEQPIRKGRGVLGVGRLRPAAIAPVVVVALLAAPHAVARSGASERGGFDPEVAQDRLAQMRRGRSEPDEPSPAATPGQYSPSRQAPAATLRTPSYSVFGDSIALSVAISFAAWERQSGQAVGIGGDAVLGCGILRGGWRRSDGVERNPPDCDRWPLTWAAVLDAHPPDIALVMSAQWELVDRRLDGQTQWRHVGDPILDDAIRADFLAATDLLASRGSTVVWITVPHFGRTHDADFPDALVVSHDPTRVDRLNRIIREVVAARPGTRILDLAGWMEPHVDDDELRSDGSHFSFSHSNTSGADMLGPALLDIWREVKGVTADATVGPEQPTANGG